MTMIDEGTRTDEVDIDLGDEPVDEDRGDGPKEPRDERWLSGFADASHLALLCLAAAVVVVAVVAWQRGSSLADEKADRREAAQVASDFTTAIQGYDARSLDHTLDAATALTTHDYGQQLEDAWFHDLQPIVEQLHARATVDVREVMLGDESNDGLTAVVMFNANVRSSVGARHMNGTYLRLDLVKVDGHWKVDDMSFLATTDQTMDSAGNGDANADQGATPPATGGN